MTRYILEIHGYNYVLKHLDGKPVSREIESIIFQHASPETATAWTSMFINEPITRSFQLSPNKYAIINSKLTDDKDSLGRGGIFHSTVEVLDFHEYITWLKRSISEFSLSTQVQADILCRITYILESIFSISRLGRHKQTIISEKYNSNRWDLCECILYKIAQNAADKNTFPFITTLATVNESEPRYLLIPSDIENFRPHKHTLVVEIKNLILIANFLLLILYKKKSSS
ncbi:MAG: hypothetical protein AAFR81_27905 [Chloroflexota bacterium]